LGDVQDLVHDPDQKYSSQAQKVAAINRGLRQRDQDTGANRHIFTVPLTPNQSSYTLTDVATLSGDPAGARIFDAVGITIIINAARLVLGQMSFTKLQAGPRAFPNSHMYPVAFSKYSPNTFILAPTPGISYTTEWDCPIYSAPMVALTDDDPLIGLFAAPPPFYAAYWLMMNMRQFQEANFFLGEYNRTIQLCQSARLGSLPSAYTPVYGR
jgi:hypothetical protein